MQATVKDKLINGWSTVMRMSYSCRLWLAFGAIMGGLFVVLSPPFTSPDEYGHFLRAYHCSIGRVYATKFKYGQDTYLGDGLPVSLESVCYDLVPPKTKLHSYQLQFTTDKLREAYSRSLEPDHCKMIQFSNSALYSPVPYVPAAFAMAIARSCGMGPLLIFYCGRAGTLAAFLVLVAMAIEITPVHKWTMMLVALMPLPMYLASALSADPITTGFALLATAMTLRCALCAEKIGRRDLLGLSLAFCLLALCKQFYIPLVLMFFIIPARKIGGIRRYIWAILGVVVLPAALNLGWIISMQPLYVPGRPGINPPAQLHYVFGHPTQFASLMYEALCHVHLYRDVVGLLGWLDVRLPWNVFYMYWIALIVTAFCDTAAPWHLSWRIRGVTLIITVVTLLCLAMSMYLSWTAVGAARIEGLQPRYFLPLLPLFLLSLRGHISTGPIMRYLRPIAPVATLATVLIACIASVSTMVHYYW